MEGEGVGRRRFMALWRRVFLPSILPGLCGLRRRLDRGWDLHLMEKPVGTKLEAQVLPPPSRFSLWRGFGANDLDLLVSVILHPPRLMRMFSLKSSHDLRFLRLGFFLS